MVNSRNMDSPVKFDLSRLSYPTLLQLTIPLLPGGVFVCGSLALNLAGARDLAMSELPVGAKITLGIFATYVIGIVFHFTSNTLAYAAGLGVANWVLRSWKVDDLPKPQNNPVWRKAARAVLGNLAPATDDLYFVNVHEQLRDSAKAIQDPELRRTQLKSVEEHYLPLQAADNEGFGGTLP